MKNHTGLKKTVRADSTLPMMQLNKHTGFLFKVGDLKAEP